MKSAALRPLLGFTYRSLLSALGVIAWVLLLPLSLWTLCLPAAGQSLEWRLAGYPLIDRAGLLTSDSAALLRTEIATLNRQSFGELVLLFLPRKEGVAPELQALAAQRQLLQADLFRRDTLLLVIVPSSEAAFAFTGADIDDMARLGTAKALTEGLMQEARQAGYAQAIASTLARLPDAFATAARGSLLRAPLPKPRPPWYAYLLNARRLLSLGQVLLTALAFGLGATLWLRLTWQREAAEVRLVGRSLALKQRTAWQA